MDQLTPKTHTTTRGLTYAYHASPAAPGKPTIVFLHGFGVSSWDWSAQASHFAPKGYGVVVPDMLGYGETDKPTDAKLYVGTGLARDVIDLLDAENLGKVIVVGYDWGARVASRVVNVFPERVAAIAFLALGYMEPDPSADYATVRESARMSVGRDVFGYWQYFSEEGTDKKLEQNMDSFISLLFPNPPELWVEHLCTYDGIKTWLESNRRSPLPAYATPTVTEHYKAALLKDGMAAPLQYYVVYTAGYNAADDATIPAAARKIAQPVFFGGAAKDYICVSSVWLESVKAHTTGPLTYHEFDSDHWILLTHSEELNAELGAWIEGLKLERV